MLRRPPALLFLALFVSPLLHASAQEKPLARTFIADSEERYQVNVAVRVETHGASTEKIGEKTYVTFYIHEADGQISWRSTRKISAVNPDGSAAVSESLDHFQMNCDKDPNKKNYDANLQKSVQETCASWQNQSQMKYEEEKFGLIRGLPVSASARDESDSPLLAYWLRRAFRPSVILPKSPIRFGAREERAVGNPSGDETTLKGQESSEWLEAPGETPAATLHVSQDLHWTNPPPGEDSKNIPSKPSMRQLFYADSLNTVSMLDGSLLKASRSASREKKELLSPIEGFSNPPEFGSKLTVTVTILRLP